MTTSHNRASAEIYQFPLRGRFAARVQHDESKAVTGLASSRLPMIAFGGNWYHEEAVRDAERARNR